MTCNLVNMWDKTRRKEIQYLNWESFGILNTSGTSKVFLKKWYVKNLTYINSTCKCIKGFSLFLTDWNFKHGKPQKSIFNVVLSSVQRKPSNEPHEAFIVNFDNHSLEMYFAHATRIIYWLNKPGISFTWRLRPRRPKTPLFKHNWNDSAGIPISLLFKLRHLRASISRQLLRRNTFCWGMQDCLVKKEPKTDTKEITVYFESWPNNDCFLSPPPPLVPGGGGGSVIHWVGVFHRETETFTLY